MFLIKNNIFIFIITSLLLYSCTNHKTELPQNKTDTTAFLKQYNRYDSFYNVYFKKREIDFLIQGGLFADSALKMLTILSDNNLKKKYCALLGYRGTDLNILGYYVQCKDLLEKYMYLYDQYKLSQEDYLAYARATVANIYSRYGDYKKAALLLEQGIKYYTSVKDTESIASCILNLSIPLKELQRYDEAEKTLQKIFQLPSLSSKRKGKGCIERADIYTRQNKIPEAGLQIQQAKKFLIAAPYDPGITDAYAMLHSIEGDWQMANNHPQEALKAYGQSVDSAIVSSAQNLRNRELGKTYIAIGKALVQLHLYDSALNYYNRALYTVIKVDTSDKFSLPQQTDIYAENTIAEALYARADCIIARGMESVQELQNAVSCYKLAFEAERKLLAAFSYDESRQHMVEETRKQSEKAIAVCYHLYQKTNSRRWANEAFLFAEHNKAFVLAESVRRNIAASLFLQNDSVYAKVQALQNNLALIEIESGKQHFSAAPDTALIRALTATRQKTEEELLAAENNLRIKNPQYNNGITNEVSLSAEEIINKSLSPAAAFIEYFTGDSSVYAFSGEKNKPLDFYKLSGNLNEMTAGLLHFFSARSLILNNPAEYASAANTLFQSLLGPYYQQKTKSLLIIPDGFICNIPFDALLTAATTSTNISSFPFLIKQQETYYAFSCKTLLAQAQAKNSSIDNSVAAFAPVFANKERGISPLLHSAEELNAIKQFYPQGRFYNGNTATMRKFEENCTNTGILHLATHANSGSDSSVAGIEFYDSTLYLTRIYTMPLKAKLLVLSGCETGTGAVNKTEGLMSLARGFSYAGTKNVIASLWQTEDNTSAAIFKSFYSNLSGNSFSTALYKAKLSAINNSSIASASPYYWAGYIYIGSPAENISSQSPGKLKLIAVLASLVLIALYIFFKRKSKQS